MVLLNHSSVEERDAGVPLEGIAIIGMAGRFPGAGSVGELWRNLCEGREGVHLFSDEELAAAGVGEELLRNPKYVKAAGVLDGIESFDAEFFGYSPREAEVTDPQHRLFLECAWHALEDAGWDITRFKRPVGIFAGAGANTYLFNLYADPDVLARLDSNQITIGNEREYLTSRVAYKLDLRGPAVTVQTACSTSLVAVHMAAQSLLAYECDMALAGGVLVCSQRSGYLYLEGGFLSPDGRNRSFDVNANGSVGGNGVCVVVLRRLQDAIDEGDHIYAVIKGSAINNDGIVKAGFTAPGIQGQAEVIIRAQALAGVAPETISYMEAHGTATALGDPAEIAAYRRAFHQTSNRKNFCAISSIKSNIGHLGEAAGAAGLVKTALSLFHKKIVPSLHFKAPNPALELEDSPFYVNTILTEWPDGGVPRRAGISSFGIGGTNAHVVLEEAPRANKPDDPGNAQLLVLSAKTKTAADVAVQNLSDALTENPDLNLADVAFTLQTGRRTFRHRRALVCSGVPDAMSILQKADPGRLLAAECNQEAPPVGFLFAGVGDQYPGMAKGLYQEIPFFRRVLDECFTFLVPLVNFDPWALLYGTATGINNGQTAPVGDTTAVDLRRMLRQPEILAMGNLDRTSHIHPILFAVEYALARLWMHWGISPGFMIGYSLGEYVAACISGVFSLHDALTLVARRAQLIDALPPGIMLALPFSEEVAQYFTHDEVSLAAVNSAQLCVVSGSTPAVTRLQDDLARKGQLSRRVSTTHAFHSRWMDPLRPQLEELLQGFKLNQPSIPYISNITGDWITPEAATDPIYWATHLSHTVQFYRSVQTAFQHPDAVFVEIGPGRNLGSLVLQSYPANAGPMPWVVSSLRYAHESGSDWTTLLENVGKLWLAGVDVDWMALHEGSVRRRVSLPGYPFERQRYWIQPGAPKSQQAQSAVDAPEIADWFYVPVWKRSFDNALSAGTESAEKKPWLVFADEQGVASRLCSRIEVGGGKIVWVRAGDSYGENASGSYTLNPARKDDYERLLVEVLVKNPEMERIVHLWSLTGQSPCGPSDFDASQTLAFTSLFNLASALRTVNLERSIRIFVLSDHLFNVTENEDLCPEKSTMLGIAMVAQQENPKLSFHCIDVGPVKIEEDTVFPILFHELMSEAGDLMVALRGRQRWIRSYDPLHLPDHYIHKLKLRKHGTYVLTGGLGGVGLLVAGYLAQKWQANLILLGRSEFPEPESWNSLPDNSSPAVLTKVIKLQAMRNAGAEVMLARADVSDESRMREIFQQAMERFGTLDGIFHLAGTAVVKALEETTANDCCIQFQAKIHGTRVLERLVHSHRIGFCIFFSSNASILGGLGFSVYAAANCFMDAFVAHASRTGSTQWISANWDGWMLPEQQREMAAQNSSIARYVMKPNESLEALARILSTVGEPQIIVSRRRLADRAKLWIQREGLFGKTIESDSPGSRHRRPHLHNEYVLPRDPIEEALAAIFEELLGVDKVGIHDNFFDLGGNSLVALQLFARVRQMFDVDLPLRMIFEASTVLRLKESIEAVRHEILMVLEHLEKEPENADAFDS